MRPALASNAVCFHSTDQSVDEFWYIVTQVAVRPTLAPLTVDAIPENLAPHVNLSSSLTGKDWDAIREHTFNTANHR